MLFRVNTAYQKFLEHTKTHFANSIACVKEMAHGMILGQLKNLGQCNKCWANALKNKHCDKMQLGAIFTFTIHNKNNFGSVRNITKTKK